MKNISYGCCNLNHVSCIPIFFTLFHIFLYTRPSACLEGSIRCVLWVQSLIMSLHDCPSGSNPELHGYNPTAPNIQRNEITDNRILCICVGECGCHWFNLWFVKNTTQTVIECWFIVDYKPQNGIQWRLSWIRCSSHSKIYYPVHAEWDQGRWLNNARAMLGCYAVLAWWLAQP